MADQPDHPQGRPSTGDSGRDERRPDDTAAFDPQSHDEPPQRPVEPGSTAAYGMPPGDADGRDPTAEQPTIEHGPTDHTAQLPPAGYPPPGNRPESAPTAPHRPGPYGDDRTAQLPPTGGQTPPWAGRAGVPPAGVPPRGPVPDEYGQPEEPGRRWWMPILIGLVVVVLLAVLAFGLWLLLRTDVSTPTPSPTISSAAPTTAAPTTAAPTTTAPSPSATTPGPVVVPPLLGLPEDRARAQLLAAGLQPRLEYRSASQPAGTVVDADPGPDTEVPPGSTVTLVVSTGPAPPPQTASPTPTASAAS
jgi:hypothetical protein